MEIRVLHNIVGGKPVDSASGQKSTIIDPANEAVIAEAPVSSAADIDQAMEVASEAFREWRSVTPAIRQRALLKIADAIETRAEEFAAVESANCGKPLALTLSGAHPRY